MVGLFTLLVGVGLVVAADLPALARPVALTTPDPECTAPQRPTEADRARRRQLLNLQREALKRGDILEAVDIQRQVVRIQCDNQYQLYYLAELLLQGGDVAGAIEWLERLYDRQVNDMEERLAHPKNAIYPLSQQPEFLKSSLAGKIAAKRQEFEQRRDRFLKKLDALPVQERPSAEYVANGVCPFECCTYTEWTVLEDTELLAGPRSTLVVGRALEGSKVQGLTGDVHLRPVPVAMVFSKTSLRPEVVIPAGTIVFLLDYVGEGYRRLWYEGEILSLKMVDAVQEQCPFPDDDCWGELLALENKKDYTWWVKVRLPDGTEGWTAEINFGNIDSCG